MTGIVLRVCAVAAALALPVLMLAVEAHAIMRDAPQLSANDPVLQELRAIKLRIEAGHAAESLPRLEILVRDYDNAADVWNIYGFALRHTGRLAESRSAYERALAIDPDHLGVHEYLGELHLAEANLAGAERLLRRLAELCARACEEHDDLARAIAAYRTEH